jgi:hypothetical protein
MITKEETLAALRELALEGRITESEAAAAVRTALSQQTGGAEAVDHRSVSLSRALYLIGGVVVLMGIIVLVVQHWAAFGSIGQVVVTLGVGVALFVSGILLRDKPGLTTASGVFSALSGVLIPLGLGVLLHVLGVDVFTPGMHMLMAAIALVIFITSLGLFKEVVYALFGILYGTWLYGSAVAYVLQDGGYGSSLYQYAAMLLGVAYLFLGYGLTSATDAAYRRLARMLYILGLLIFLGTALSMGGAWDVIYPFVVFAVIFSSIYLHSGIFLKIGSLFLMIYLIKMSAQYFSGSLGWPLALVLAGLMLMGVGYLTYYLNKKYIREPNTEKHLA